VSGPGNRAPKPRSLRELTQSKLAENHGEVPTRVDVAPALPPESKEFGTFRELPAREPGDLDGASPPMVGGRQLWEGKKPEATERAVEESDAEVVSEKLSKTMVTRVEAVERRAAAKGKSVARNALPTQGGPGAHTALQRIWHRSLQRRSQRAKWTATRRYAFADKFPLPTPRIHHPWPRTRFGEKHLR